MPFMKSVADFINKSSHDFSESINDKWNRRIKYQCQEMLRHELERESKAPWPQITAARAVSYASLIYQWATHGVKIDLDWVEDKIASTHGLPGNITTTVTDLMKDRVEETYRSWSGPEMTLNDKSPGLAIIKVEGRDQGNGKEEIDEEEEEEKPPAWRHIYVVFRGSRGDKYPDLVAPVEDEWELFTLSKEQKEARDLACAANPKGAGWDGKYNVDWRANFDNQQIAYDLADTGARVHRGFLSIYSSLRQAILQTLVHEWDAKTEVIVTGHSLGGALATLCAYDLHHQGVYPVLMAFCSPRVGDETFAKDFNQKLAYQSWNHPKPDAGSFFRAYRFDQFFDPVTWGAEHAFKPIPLDNDLPEKAVTVKGGMGALRELDTMDLDQPYFHVQNKITISKGGFHQYTAMMDEIFGSLVTSEDKWASPYHFKG